MNATARRGGRCTHARKGAGFACILYVQYRTCLLPYRHQAYSMQYVYHMLPIWSRRNSRWSGRTLEGREAWPGPVWALLLEYTVALVRRLVDGLVFQV